VSTLTGCACSKRVPPSGLAVTTISSSTVPEAVAEVGPASRLAAGASWATVEAEKSEAMETERMKKGFCTVAEWGSVEAECGERKDGRALAAGARTEGAEEALSKGWEDVAARKARERGECAGSGTPRRRVLKDAARAELEDHQGRSAVQQLGANEKRRGGRCIRHPRPIARAGKEQRHRAFVLTAPFVPLAILVPGTVRRFGMHPLVPCRSRSQREHPQQLRHEPASDGGSREAECRTT
jgi:hypothetical protein